MRRLFSILALLAALSLAPSTASAKPHLAGTFDLSGQPNRIALGPDGNIWVTIMGGSNPLAKIEPNGDVTEYSPAAVVNPTGITAGRDDDLWLTRNGGVIRVPVDDPDNATDTNIAALGAGQDITKGPGGRMWTASGDQLVSFDPTNPAGATAKTIDDMSARGITSSGGKVFVADFSGKRIVRSTADGQIKKFKVGGGPQQVTSGPQGSVAYTNPGSVPQTVGRIAAGGFPQKTKEPDSDPFGIDFAADHNWWIGEFAKDRLGILSPGGGLKHFTDLPNDSGPRYLAVGKNNTLWVGLEGDESVARIKDVG